MTVPGAQALARKIKEIREIKESYADMHTKVLALAPLLEVHRTDGGYDCCGCSTLGKLHEDILAIIDEHAP